MSALKSKYWRMARRLGFLGGFLCASCVTMQPVQTQGEDAYIVVDFHTKKILNERNGNKKRQVASLTKIVAATVVLDWAELAKVDLGTYMQVPGPVGQMTGANPLGLRPGDEITIRSALYSAIMGSDNASAETLAAFVGTDLVRRQGGGNPMEAFVKEMNNLAARQGCTNSKFTNAHGLDHERPVPHSTAADMARLTLYALSKASFTFYSSQKERRISFRRAGQEMSFIVRNTNKLVGQHDIDGVKTGLTTRAGQCLVTSAKQPSRFRDAPDGRKIIIPRRLVVVVLDSPNRFDQSLFLLQQGWQQLDAWYAAGRPVLSAEELLTGF